MFDCNVTISIRHPLRGANGEIVYSQSTARALRMECRARERGGAEPAITERTEFLIAPPAEVFPGDLIRCGTEDFELAEVRVCRNLDGNTVAYRCRVVQ